MNNDLFVLEHIEEFTHVDTQQKKRCSEMYGFPRNLVTNPNTPQEQSHFLISRLLGCMLFPASPEKDSHYLYGL